MAYAAVIQALMQIAGTAVGANTLQKARGGYEAQLGKWKKVKPIKGEDPKMTDWQQIIKDVISGNLENLPQSQELAARTNKFNVKQAEKGYAAIQPKYEELQAQLGQNALSYSKGELPQDVVQSIGRAAAQRGIQGGFGYGQGAGGGGQALGNLNLRNLGLASLDLSKFGSQMAMDAGTQAKNLSPDLFDASSMFIRPQEGVAYEDANVMRQNEADRYWNMVQNQAEWTNTATANLANQKIAEGNLAARAQEAKMWSSMGSSSSKSGGGGGGGGGAGGFSSILGGGA